MLALYLLITKYVSVGVGVGVGEASRREASRREASRREAVARNERHYELLLRGG
ncbi:hypothetical protein [Komarekiella delphini-convector]|uniref:hypothetical protein n=1 Tax=Komarekiella delphini-convector TaxID=3050158 RepID=UPI001781D944|nr:hypothetical protein [Komarekiella delphini-convector]